MVFHKDQSGQQESGSTQSHGRKSRSKSRPDPESLAAGQMIPDNASADHYGSREETNAALEEKIAIQNTRRLHSRP